MSAPEEKKARDYSRYDQMSTAELEQILRLDFQASEEDDSDLDAILYLSDLLAKRNGPSEADAAWEQFGKKYRLCADGSSLYDLGDEDDAPAVPPPARSRRAFGPRRLAVLAAALVVCLLGGMAAQAAGVNVLGAIGRWTDEAFHFVGTGSNGCNLVWDGENGAQIRATLEEIGAVNRFPTWYPDGFTPKESRLTGDSSASSVYVSFTGEERSYSVIIRYFYSTEGSTGIFEKDDTPVEEYEHNGQTFYILSNLNSLTATAYDGTYMTIISGLLTREELKQIIDSIPNPQAMENRERMREILAEKDQILYCPQIPEGFELADFDFYIDPVTGTAAWTEGYVRGDQFLGFFVSQHETFPDMVHEKDDTPVETYVYNGVTHYLLHNNTTVAATWMLKDVEYSLWATDGAVDLKELVRSVYAAK